MAAIITEKFRLHNAEQFFESFSEASASTYYLFIGKGTPWTSGTTGGSDPVPPSPVDDISSEYYYWDDMLAAKLISSSNIAYVIPRRNWANTTTFDMYEHDISVSNTATSGASNLFDSTFYFITSEYKVYKVLDNNGGTAYSGSEPTFDNTGAVKQFVGGYYLQYMYTLTTAEIQNFLTNDFMPVRTTSGIAGSDGQIDVVRVTTGSGYTDGTYYAPIDGDGSSGIVKIFVTGGSIAAFGSGAAATEVYAEGSGYTYATVDLTDVYTDAALSSSTTMGAGINGVVQPIIGPKSGHGSNAVNELGGHYVMTNTKLEQAEGDDFTVLNDFRRVGIVRDPFNFGTTTVATASTRRQTYAVRLESSPTPGTFEPDEEIQQQTTGAVGRVVEWDSTNRILYYQQERFSTYGIDSTGNYTAFSGVNVIEGQTSGATGTPTSDTESVTLAGGNTISFTSGYSNPELQPDSGDVLYIENRRPISRASDQTEDIKIIVEF